MFFNVLFLIILILSDGGVSLLLTVGCPRVWLPDFGVIAALYAALRRGPAAGLWAGLMLGLLRQYLGADESWLVIFAGITFLYALGRFKHLFFVHSPVTPLLLPTVFYGLIWTIQFAQGNYEDDRSRWMLWGLGMGNSALWATAVAGPFIFGLMSRWDRGYQKEESRDAWLRA